MAQISHEIEQVIYRFIDLIKEEKRILKVFLYGSHAKGTPSKWSDIDLAVVSPDFSEDLFDERVKLMRAASNVDERIEPSPFKPADFNENDPLVREINRSGVEIELEPFANERKSYQ